LSIRSFDDNYKKTEMMYRAILTPTETTLTIELPKELIGKSVEVIAFELEKQALEMPRKKISAEEITSFYQDYQADMSGYKFNRDEANER
jgi:hypothetical protein